jgi:hypothetical protein
MEILLIILFAVMVLYYLYGTYVSAAALRRKHLKTTLRCACLLRVISFLVVLSSVGLYVAVHVKKEIISYSYKNGVIIETSSYGRFDTVFFLMFIAAILLIAGSMALDSAGASAARIRGRNLLVSFIMCVTVFVIGLIIIVTNYQSKLGDKYDPKFYRYDSADKSRSIVICERSRGSEGYADIFQVKDQRAVKIGELTTQDGLRNEGRYKMKWSKDSVEIIYLYKGTLGKTANFKFAAL